MYMLNWAYAKTVLGLVFNYMYVQKCTRRSYLHVILTCNKARFYISHT